MAPLQTRDKPVLLVGATLVVGLLIVLMVALHYIPSID